MIKVIGSNIYAKIIAIAEKITFKLVQLLKVNIVIVIMPLRKTNRRSNNNGISNINCQISGLFFVLSSLEANSRTSSKGVLVNTAVIVSSREFFPKIPLLSN